MLASEKEELQVNETLGVMAMLLFPWQTQTQFPLQSMSWGDTSPRVLQEAA